MPRGRYRSRSLIFRKPQAENDAERLADAMGWPVRGEIAADHSRGIPYEVMWGVGPILRLHYLEDDLSASSYLVFSGDKQDAVDAATRVAERHLEFFSFDELLTAVVHARDDAEKCRAIIRAAIGAPREFDECFFELIRDLLRNKNPALREAAIWAISYPGWPVFFDLLRSTARTDPSRRIRDTAEGMLGAFAAADGANQ